MSSSSRCPHCRNEAGTEPHPVLRYRCRICGGPRIFAGEGIELSGREQAPLKAAKSARRTRIALLTAAIVSAGFGTAAFFITAIILLLTQPGTFALLFSALLVLIPYALAGYAWSGAKKRVAQFREALDDAWLSAATDVVAAQSGEVNSRELAARLGIDEDYADQLLARLNVDDRVLSRVTDDGDIVYSTAPGQRLRAPELEPLRDDESSYPSPRSISRRSR